MCHSGLHPLLLTIKNQIHLQICLFFYPLLISNQPSISNIATKIIHAFISFLLDGVLFAFPSRPLDELQHVLTAAHLAPTLTPDLDF